MTGSDSADDSADNLKLVRRSGESYHVIHNMAIIDVITPLNNHCCVQDRPCILC